jgi:hypothetical protein
LAAGTVGGSGLPHASRAALCRFARPARWWTRRRICPRVGFVALLGFGHVGHFEVHVGDLVDADLVGGALEGFVAGHDLLARADERDAHRAPAVVRDVVVAAQDVLAQLDVAREAPVREGRIDLGQGRVVRVVLRSRVATLLLHAEHERKRRMGRGVGGTVGVLEVVETSLVDADDPPVQHEQPRAVGPDCSRELPVGEFAQASEPVRKRTSTPALDLLDRARFHITWKPKALQIACGPNFYCASYPVGSSLAKLR